jgi:hypothetical protein
MKLTHFSHWGAAPGPFLFWFFCGEAEKKPKQKHYSGVCNPQSPALQSGKPLSFMRMGRRPLATPRYNAVHDVSWCYRFKSLLAKNPVWHLYAE